uniref:Solute carrier family 47 member 3 n=1 Tax=Salmo trutta TaxID=8032 RepID=A0A674CM25_SALTR
MSNQVLCFWLPNVLTQHGFGLDPNTFCENISMNLSGTIPVSEPCEDWGTYIHLAIPSMIMLLFLLWFDILSHYLSMAGLISEVELGAQSVVFELASICYMFPLGFSVAGSVRVGSALGAGDTEQAKLSAKLSAKLAMFFSVCLSVLVGTLKDKISYICARLETCTSGLVRGAGQKVGAICNILGYYGVGFSIGVSLMFAGHKDRRALAEDGADGEAGDRVALIKVEALLAHRALIMRRGLALCHALHPGSGNHQPTAHQPHLMNTE